jgi:acetoin utilization protein AcuB
MLVRDWMSEDVVTIGVNDSVQRALDLMQDYHISLLPVTDGGKLVGIVSDRDLKRAAPSEVSQFGREHIDNFLSLISVVTVMTPNPITVPDDFTVEETAEVLLDNKISGCPVRDSRGRMVGIVTKSDLFRAIISVTGLPKKGFQIGVLLEDVPGCIEQVIDIIRSHGGRLVSILTSDDRAPKGYRHAYFRAFDMDGDKFTRLKSELKRKLELTYIVDHREKRREICNSR